MAEYLNHGKLIASPLFLELVLSATADAIEKSTLNNAELLLNAFKGATQLQQVEQWFTDRLGMVVRESNGRLRLMKKKKSAVACIVNISEYFPEADRARRVSALAVRKATQGAIRTPRVDGEIDLMDTKLRLPGSFESGKRR